MYHWLAILFILIGGVLVFLKIKPNPLLGIRVCWAYYDEGIWHRTNKLCGISFLILGSLLLLAKLEGQTFLIVMITGAILIGILGVAYSMILYYRKYGTLKIQEREEGRQISTSQGNVKKLMWWEIIPVGMIVFSFVMVKCMYNQLPAQIPLHFSPGGIADRWGAKFYIYIFNLIPVVIYLPLAIYNLHRHIFRRPKYFYYFEIYIIYTLVALLFVVIQYAIIQYALGNIMNINTIIMVPEILLVIGSIVAIVSGIVKSKTVFRAIKND